MDCVFANGEIWKMLCLWRIALYVLSMNDSFASHLAFLYGAETGNAVLPELQKLIEHWREEIPLPLRTARDLTQTDAILIAYGDQVRAENQPPLRTLAKFLDAQTDGILSGVHLLPFFPSTSDDGFSVADYFAVDPALGDWQEIRRVGENRDLMFDAVFNHCSAQGEWFRRYLEGEPAFRNFFIAVSEDADLSQVVRPRALPLLAEFFANGEARKIWTTFSADQIDLNFQNPKVLLAILDVLLFYISNGARFIRLDAIAYLWKEIGTACIHLPQTHCVIHLMRAALNSIAPGVRLITETNVPHRDNISYFGDGENEAQLVYNFALPPLVLHSIRTGDATALSKWADTLATPGKQTTFFNFLASHDGIGLNPTRGILKQSEIDALVKGVETHGGFVSWKSNSDGTKSPYELNINYFDALSDPAGNEPLDLQVARFLAAHAAQLALAGVPGIYFHSLFGSRGDRATAEASGIPRRINREKLQRNALENELQSPDSLRAKVFGGFQQMLAARKSCAAFAPAAPQKIVFANRHLFIVKRGDISSGECAICIQNLSDEQVELTISFADSAIDFDPEFFANGEAKLHTLLGSETSWDQVSEGISLHLDPYEVLWLSA